MNEDQGCWEQIAKLDKWLPTLRPKLSSRKTDLRPALRAVKEFIINRIGPKVDSQGNAPLFFFRLANSKLREPVVGPIDALFDGASGDARLFINWLRIPNQISLKAHETAAHVLNLLPRFARETTTPNERRRFADDLLAAINGYLEARHVTVDGDGNSVLPTEPRSMKKSFAEMLAKQLLQRPSFGTSFGLKSAKEWGHQITLEAERLTGDKWTCAASTVHGTKCWGDEMRRTGRSRQSRSVKADNYSAKTAAKTKGADGVLNELAAREEQSAIDAVMQSSMADNAKHATLEKIQVGEMTLTQALKLAAKFPKRRKSKKACIRE